MYVWKDTRHHASQVNCIINRVHRTQGKPGKSGKNLEKLKNQGKP